MDVCFAGNLDIAKYLLNEGADFNVQANVSYPLKFLYSQLTNIIIFFTLSDPYYLKSTKF
jgi:hypothetical protein